MGGASGELGYDKKPCHHVLTTYQVLLDKSKNKIRSNSLSSLGIRESSTKYLELCQGERAILVMKINNARNTVGTQR